MAFPVSRLHVHSLIVLDAIDICCSHRVENGLLSIAVVENLEKKREPLLSVSGVYFITPTDRSVQLLLNDWKMKPQYRTAHVFFTSKITPGQLQAIKTCSGLAQRLRSLKEVCANM